MDELLEGGGVWWPQVLPTADYWFLVLGAEIPVNDATVEDRVFVRKIARHSVTEEQARTELSRWRVSGHNGQMVHVTCDGVPRERDQAMAKLEREYLSSGREIPGSSRGISSL